MHPRFSSNFGKFWGCSEWPKCDGTISAHQETGEPLGIPVDKATREARIQAHAAFDPLWRGKGSPFRGRRDAAYKWLQHTLGIRSRYQCHIGMFDAAMCGRVLEVCDEYATRRGARSA
jgi:hypothetical protein